MIPDESKFCPNCGLTTGPAARPLASSANAEKDPVSKTKTVQPDKAVVRSALAHTAVLIKIPKLVVIGYNQQCAMVCHSYETVKDVANSSLQAKDITVKSLTDKIVSDEQRRLGFEVRGASAKDLSEAYKDNWRTPSWPSTNNP